MTWLCSLCRGMRTHGVEPGTMNRRGRGAASATDRAADLLEVHVAARKERSARHHDVNSTELIDDLAKPVTQRSGSLIA